MNELVANHQNIIGQKDKLLADYQKQVETLQKAETELTKQIDEQKAKNNVRSFSSTQLNLNSHPHSILNYFFWFQSELMIYLIFLLPRFSLTIRTRSQFIPRQTPGFANEKLEIGWGITISSKFNSQID